MTDTLYLFKVGMTLGLWLSGPLLLLAVVVGLVVSLLQAAFQLQDQTLPIVSKLLGAAVVIAMTWTWMSGLMVDFMQQIFDQIAQVTAV